MLFFVYLVWGRIDGSLNITEQVKTSRLSHLSEDLLWCYYAITSLLACGWMLTGYKKETQQHQQWQESQKENEE